MHEIDTMRARVQAADALAGTLAAAHEAFELLLVMCEQCEGRRDELFAAFAFASAAAAEGRNIIAAAPSLAPGPGARTAHGFPAAADPEKIADALADLARELGARLSATARRADDGDQDACRDAAREADQIHDLLARDE
jgi:hypothetical protein